MLVGGHQNSFHIMEVSSSCEASDITTRVVSLLELFLRACRYFNGVGIYPTKNIVHVDIRKMPYRFVALPNSKGNMVYMPIKEALSTTADALLKLPSKP